MGIEVHRSDRPFTLAPGWPPRKPEPAGEAKGRTPSGKDAKPGKETITFPAGSFVIRMDQPYSRLADALLDTQYVLGQERVYDDIGWTLGYTKNVECKRIVNQGVLQMPMHPWDGRLEPRAIGDKGQAIAIINHADTDLVRLRYQLADAKFAVLEGNLDFHGRTLPAGTIVVEASERARQAIAALGSLEVQALDAWPKVKTHDLRLPRIALLHSWLDTQDEGWFRLAFASFKGPYDYISTQQVATIADLRSRYDVIVFPPAGGEPADIVDGLPAGPPLPWKRTTLTPNLGVDETDDMRPGMGLTGVKNLETFVKDGGLL